MVWVNKELENSKWTSWKEKSQFWGNRNSTVLNIVMRAVIDQKSRIRTTNQNDVLLDCVAMVWEEE